MEQKIKLTEGLYLVCEVKDETTIQEQTFMNSIINKIAGIINAPMTSTTRKYSKRKPYGKRIKTIKDEDIKFILSEFERISAIPVNQRYDAIERSEWVSFSALKSKYYYWIKKINSGEIKIEGR